jgi:hypothetical protein
MNSRNPIHCTNPSMQEPKLLLEKQPVFVDMHNNSGHVHFPRMENHNTLAP